MMEWMGTRRGWREVGPYPPGLKAGTACAVYVGGGEKVVVTGTLDGKGGGGRHALWVFDVKTKQWTVVGPLPEFAGFVFSVTSSPRVAGPVIHACVLVPAAPSACSSSVLDPRALVEVPQTPVPAVRFGRIWRDSGCCRDEMWARSVIGGGASLVLKSNGSDPIECGTI
ncbi:hypothetical protein SEVIR_6G166300v4 [Setaria viridis]|uniref:Uncharacterized protein n=1 Tax=Setaria viridis TaxID=4556 RepID=A0A4U6UIW5_SETVI|nr:hypothetical protein SEVIR_6G166300v2 [Setaria viridis]